jgi:nicotinate dehydrogenase subunit A
VVSYALRVNGATRSVEAADENMPLLYALRGPLGLHGPKFGCGLGQCGACTVIVDGAAARSCQLAIADMAGKEITTLEGLGSPEQPHPIQAAFIEEQAAQCGYCINGMIMTAKAYLDRNPRPSEVDVKTALAENLCRCGTHPRVVSAVLRSAETLAKGR